MRTREEILAEALRIHDERYGERHCDRKYVYTCKRLREAIFETGGRPADEKEEGPGMAADKSQSITPAAGEPPDQPQIGEWVKAWGQVVKDEAAPHHPDDVVIEMFSHNSQYMCHVRRDRVERVDHLPEFATGCLSMRGDQRGPGHYLRCLSTLNHGGLHRNGDKAWDDSHADGYFEER